MIHFKIPKPNFLTSKLKTIEISNDSNNDPIDFDDDSQPKFHQIKTDKNIEISSALENYPNVYDIMHYWYEYLQLTNVDGNIFLT
jgi:hypothetical protein